MSGTTSLGIVYPTGGDTPCRDPNDPTGIRTGLREMADTIEPLFVGWAPTVAAVSDRPRAQLRSSNGTVLSANGWQVPFDTLVMNHGTATDLGLVPGIVLSSGVWRVEFTFNIGGGAPGTPGPWVASCIGLDGGDLWDYGPGQQNSITLAGLVGVAPLNTLTVTATGFPPLGGNVGFAYSTLTAIKMN